MTQEFTRYVAFLRGINVGGNKIIKMADLKKAFESLGLTNVKTILASGNVIFETEPTSIESLTTKIEQNLEKTFTHKISTLLRTSTEIQTLINSEPFKNIKVNPQTRLYITFLSSSPTSELKIPYELLEKNFRILRVSKGEVSSVLVRSPNKNTSDLMSILEKEFGKNITTRNWNTVTRIGKFL